MARQEIGVGTTGNDGTGDDLRTAGQKINSNFTELYQVTGALQLANGGAGIDGIAFDQRSLVFIGADSLNSNPSDAGRFMNHSNTPNCGPDGALRDIEIGEELTMNYNFHGNPQWYIDICDKYGVLTERQVAEKYS